jgi:Flp pilus assembly protein TadD
MARRLALLIVAGLLVSVALIAGTALAPRSNAPVVPTAPATANLPSGHPDVTGGSGSTTTSGGQTAEQALAAAQATVRTSPRDVAALLSLGEAYLQTDRGADAERTYTKALQIDKGNAEAQAGLVMVRIQRGETDTAVADLKRLAARYRRRQTVLYDLAIAYYVTNQRELATNTWRSVVELGANTDQGQMAAQFLSIMKAPGTTPGSSNP